MDFSLETDDDREPTRIDGTPLGKDHVAPRQHKVPPIELEIVHVGPDGPSSERFAAIEIWTRNTVYAVNASLVCVQVRDCATGREVPDHAVIGSRLLGGKRAYQSSIHISQPLPLLGMHAVFGAVDSATQSDTSRVVRIVQRVRVASASLERGASDWDDVTNGLLRAPFER
jgi:hypothetical protein